MRKYYITDAEIKEAEDYLESKGVGWVNGKYHKPTKVEDKTLMEELSAMRMIHSFIAYRPIEKKNQWINDKYMEVYLKELGADKLQKLIDLACDRVLAIGHAGYDSEGVNYNSIKWS